MPIFPDYSPGVPYIILQPNGQPVDRPPVKLTEENSGKSLMTGYDAYLKSVFRVPKWNPDALIQHKGYDVLYQMMTMACVSTPLDLKMQAALYKTPQVLSKVANKKGEKEPGFRPGDYEKAQEARDYCQYLIDNIRSRRTGRKTPFRAVLWNILQAVPFGLSANELITEVEDSGPYKNKRTLSGVISRPVEQIAFDLAYDTLEVLNVLSWTPGHDRAAEVPASKVCLYTYKPSRGLPWGNGDLRKMYKHYWSIDCVMRWWGIAQKRFGSPFIEGITNNPNKLNEMMASLAMVDDGMNFAHIKTDEYNIHWPPSSSLDTFQTFASYHSQQMMMAVLGNTLTTTQGDGSSSYALGQTHQNSQNFFLSFPRHDVEMAVTDQIFETMVVMNLGEEYRHVTPRLFLGHWDDNEKRLIMQILEIAANIGLIDPREDWCRDYVDLPQMPEGFDPNDDSLPLLPSRERITKDISTNGTGETPPKKVLNKQRDDPNKAMTDPKEIEDAFMVISDYLWEKNQGLATDIREAAQV